jgi:dipeptidyl aminopeptidase/acylaminoacyl peptidase
MPATLEALGDYPEFDRSRCAIGGFSLGGMIALAALCRPHAFSAALIEASSGDWSHMESARLDPGRAERMEPLRHLDGWRPVPLLALHAALDAMVPVAPQREFIAGVRSRSPGVDVRWHEFARTGAPSEHIGFGACAAEAKAMGTQFLVERLRGA